MQVADAVYTKLLAATGSAVQNLADTHKRLEGYSSSASQQADQLRIRLRTLAEFSGSGPEIFISILKVSKVDELFHRLGDRLEEYMQAVRSHIKQGSSPLILTNFPSDTAWLEKAVESIVPNMEAYVESFTIRSVLSEHYTEDAVENLVITLRQMGGVLFPFDPSRGQVRDIEWVLVADEENFHFLSEYFQTVANVVPSHYVAPHSHEAALISFTWSIHPESMKGLDRYREEYQKLQEKYVQAYKVNEPFAPVHVWLDAWEWEEPSLARETFEKSRRIFALALAFAHAMDAQGKKDEARLLIYYRGSFYYMRMGTHEIRLGHGLSSALETFRANERYWRHLEGVIQDFIERYSVPETCKWVREYASALDKRIQASRLDHDPALRSALKGLLQALCDYLREYFEKCPEPFPLCQS